MQRDFPITVEVDGRKVTQEGGHRHLRARDRAHAGEPAPGGHLQAGAEGRASVTKIRTYTQAEKDLADLETLLGTEATPQVQYGMWTNGIDFFFLHKTTSKFSAKFEPQASWPLADESVRPDTVASVGRLRRGEAGMLKTAFRRCHNYIHGNEGMPKDAAFWQFLYLLFAKMHDEREACGPDAQPEFYVLPVGAVRRRGTAGDQAADPARCSMR